MESPKEPLATRRKNYLQRVYTPSLMSMRRMRMRGHADSSHAKASLLRSVATLIGLVLVGMLFRDATFGRIFIMIYGLAAIVIGIPALQTYKMAAISLACIPLLTLLRGTTLSENFAQYAFLLFVTGVVCSIVEYAKTTILQRREAKIGIKAIASPEDLP